MEETASDDATRDRAAQVFDGLHAALFDLDNTLVETHIDFPAMKRSVLELAAAFGLDTRELERRDILGIVDFGVEALGGSRGADFREQAFEMLADIEEAECGAPTKLPGAAEMLLALRRAHIPVAIVTRNCRAVSLKLVKFAGLHCDAVLAREDVARTKPDAGHLLAALDRLPSPRGGEGLGVRSLPSPRGGEGPGVREPEPGRTVMVGDNWMDCAAGRAAGMRTIGLRRGRPDMVFENCPPDLIVEDMAELYRLWRETRSG